ncbi:MAG: thiamine-phosphate diphosphorylase [Fibrobacteres bacterium]|nr:thiamine-phosphate diphosphorylase [Fibrobacterota bacterium]
MTLMADGFSPADKPLYFVTDHNLTAGRAQLEVIEAALSGGVRWVQYRDKDLPDAGFEREAKAALDLCRKHGALLLINDRVAIAKAIGAHGVHLGQDDMDPEEARRVLGPQAVIGISTHNREEVLAAENQPVDYINIGPMFPTATKDHSRYGALGPDLVLELSRLSRHPFTTMGGIKKSHLRDLFSRGVKTVAMVTEISLAPDPAARTRELLAEIQPPA